MTILVEMTVSCLTSACTLNFNCPVPPRPKKQQETIVLESTIQSTEILERLQRSPLQPL